MAREGIRIFRIRMPRRRGRGPRPEAPQVLVSNVGKSVGRPGWPGNNQRRRPVRPDEVRPEAQLGTDARRRPCVRAVGERNPAANDALLLRGGIRL